MARSGYVDLLQSHRFWAFDAGSLTMPVFNPLFGFNSISSPEISLETETFKDGTFPFMRTVAKGATASSLTFTRGVAPWDGDFYDWIARWVYGSYDSVSSVNKVIRQALNSDTEFDLRRDIVLVHFTRIDPIYTISRSISGTGTTITQDDLAGLGGIGPFSVLTKIPGKAWRLRGCVPLRYKAGSDFDAQQAAMSIGELEIQPESIEEFNLGVGSPASLAGF